ncbi:hypothetical protein [Pelotomaculum propionicicum]|uniref:Uncharacterized protein n=1 Tax=Pelotomaculum propionicicum TaxID=258475 RepID=A0A4Y7RXU6_9FIRM|nr:hypothetical protein [Pelotomaculum propionicicum]TEB13731.1 hypothetical protein Pmgp_00138 [Pelotomaculum propionicicum]
MKLTPEQEKTAESIAEWKDRLVNMGQEAFLHGIIYTPFAFE